MSELYTHIHLDLSRFYLKFGSINRTGDKNVIKRDGIINPEALVFFRICKYCSAGRIARVPYAHC